MKHMHYTEEKIISILDEREAADLVLGSPRRDGGAEDVAHQWQPKFVDTDARRQRKTWVNRLRANGGKRVRAAPLRGQRHHLNG